MVTKEQLLAIFPLKAKVTAKHLTTDRLNPNNCIGASTLKDALSAIFPDENLYVSWSISDGYIHIYGSRIWLQIGTTGNINMMKLTEETDVTFRFIREQPFEL